MYTKEQLEQMEIPQLMAVAEQLGVKVSQDDALETVVYNILDKAAIDAASEQPAPKRKRARIKTGTEATAEKVTEAGAKAAKKKKVAKDEPEAAAADSETPTDADDKSDVEKAQELLTAPPKHRGRKSKAELAAIAAAKALLEISDQEEEEAEESDDNTDVADENVNDDNDNNDEPSMEQLTQLQEKMSQHNSENAYPQTDVTTNDMDENGVWMGDPGDGTDFITIVDLPIEDQGAMPTLDIFDRPVAPQQAAATFQPVMSAPAGNANTGSNETYDFGESITGTGVLELAQDGYGFLRSGDYNYLSSPDDIYVSAQQVKKYGLKTGDVVECSVRIPNDGDKFFALSTVIAINGRKPEDVRDRVNFEHLTPLFPEEKFNICGDPRTTNPSTRIVDLFAPIGKGQRALIVAQPKTGKTILMKDIANAIAANHPEAYIMMLLIDERPEEVTDMSRTVNAEVIASTFDEPADRHVKIAGIVLEKAKRMVECGHDVVIFLDSITRLARAYNTVAPASGKVLTGGVDANALQKPKRFFGAARNIENGGSLTIIATALVDTGSKMDEVIFEEFKGTGNSEIQLDRMLSNKRIFPALNLVQSSTRRDDLLQDEMTLNRMWIIRKIIAEMSSMEAMNVVRDRLVHARDNEEFLMSMNG